MALTVIEVETILIYRVGTLFAAVGLDGTTVDGDNPDLVDPIGYSIRQLGGTVATITDITDADLAPIAADDYDELLDVAELRALQNAYSAATTMIDTKIGARDEKLSNVATTLASLVKGKQKLVEDAYQIGLPTLSTGVVDLNFQQKLDDTVIGYD